MAKTQTIRRQTIAQVVLYDQRYVTSRKQLIVPTAPYIEQPTKLSLAVSAQLLRLNVARDGGNPGKASGRWRP